MLFLSLDFETTGLNTTKDDPIQVGLVIFDKEANIKASYSSLIKPNKSIKELKEIVQYVTGFDIAGLQFAPPHQQVFSEIQEYLQKDMILVGHNVSFDLAILQRFIPDRSPLFIIDTFDCARQLLHFQQSYALDALIHIDQQQQLHIFDDKGGKSHDALYDATASMQLFLWWYQKVVKLIQNYPNLGQLLQKNHYTNLVFNTHLHGDTSIRNTLPHLINTFDGDKKLISHIHQNQDNRVERPLDKVLDMIDFNSPNPIILSLQHSSKITIVKSLLQQRNIRSFDSMHDIPKLNQKNVEAFLQKSPLSRSEIGFLIKYFSQFDKGHHLVDCKSVDDYKILNAITDLQENGLEKITLCTHQHLWSFSHKITPNTDIYFFDADHRLSSYIQSLQQPIDLLYMINLIDQISYRYGLEKNSTLHNACQTLVTQISIFSAYFHKHMGYYFDSPVTQLECHSLDEDYRDRKAWRLLGEIDSYIGAIASELLGSHNGTVFFALWKRCVQILQEPFIVEKRTYNDSRYLIFHAPAYHVQYEDFLESLPQANYHWIDSKQYTMNKEKGIIYVLDQNFQGLNQLLQKKSNLFILCQSKQHSKGLFDRMIQQKLDSYYSILAENITGGTGKAMLFAKKSKKTIIMIGSEQYLYYAIGNSIGFGSIGLRYYKTIHKNQLINDLLFYL